MSRSVVLRDSQPFRVSNRPRSSVLAETQGSDRDANDHAIVVGRSLTLSLGTNVKLLPLCFFETQIRQGVHVQIIIKNREADPSQPLILQETLEREMRII